MTSTSETEEQEAAARRYVAKKTDEMDEEYEVLCALGLM
jgi:hypothetical protein